MLARYLDFVHRHRGPAVLYVPATDRFFTNPIAESLYGDASELHAAMRTDAKSHKTIEFEPAAGSRLLLIPLVDIRGDLNAVIAVDGEMNAAPAIVQRIFSTEWRFNELLHRVPQIVVTARPNGSIDYISRRWSDVIGPQTSGQTPQQIFESAVYDADRSSFGVRWSKGVGQSEEFSFELRLARRGGARWYRLTASPWAEHGDVIKWIVALDDIEFAVRSRNALARTQQRLRFLADAGSILGHADDPVALARGIAQLAASSLATWCAVRYTGGQGSVAASAPYVDERIVQSADALMDEPPHEVFASFVAPVDAGAGSIIALPLHLHGDPAGSIVFGTAPDAARFDESDYKLASEVAERLERALERSTRFEREHQIAEALQRALLHVNLPQSANTAFDVSYNPAQAEVLVGGDWYDAFALDDGRIAFAIGDVAGHGLSAAIEMGKIRQGMRVAAWTKPDPADVLARVNESILSEGGDHATALFCVYDPYRRELHFAVAGHPPPLIVQPDGSITELSARGIPLGLRSKLSLESKRVTLPDRGALVLYTDGVIEISRDIREGESYLRQTLSRWAQDGFLDDARTLQETLRQGRESFDDAALLILRFTETEVFDTTIEATPFAARRTRHALDRFLSARGLREEQAFRVTLALTEAMSNSIVHGYAGRKQGHIRLRVACDGQACRATVADSGRWREGRPSPYGGRGIALLRELSDGDVRFETSPHGTTVHLTFPLDAPLPEGAHATVTQAASPA